MNKRTFTVFFGDTSEYPMQCATEYDPTAILMDHNNYQSILKNPAGTVYSSLGDLPKDISLVYQLLSKADKIFYCDWAQFVDPDSPSLSQKGFTHHILSLIAKIKNNVYNLNLSQYDPSQYLELVDTRKSKDPQLWIVGCSISHGVGVGHFERYGYLLGGQLNLPVSFLTQPGSSIDWAADQILRSDICKDDIIVWGVTSENRLPIWNSELSKLVHFNIQTKEIIPEYKELTKLLVSNHVLYSSFTHIHQVNNFCKKTQAKLLLLGILNSDVIQLNLHNLENFIQYKTFSKHKDLGADNLHPGPKQHQIYADFCHSTLKQLNYI